MHRRSCNLCLTEISSPRFTLLGGIGWSVSGIFEAAVSVIAHGVQFKESIPARTWPLASNVSLVPEVHE